MTLIFLIIIFIITLSWSILLRNNPITLSMIILSIAVCSSTLIRLLLSSWYAIVLFLIYIGGIIVIFSYFVSFSSNDSIWYKRKIQFIIIPLIIYKSLNIQRLIPINSNTQINKLYLSSNIVIIVLITLILLLIIIIIIKIVKTNNGPLRGYYTLES